LIFDLYGANLQAAESGRTGEFPNETDYFPIVVGLLSMISERCN
jgi:hypothetical protein